MEQERIVIDRGGSKIITLIIQPFDTDINIDDLLRIDYNNIMGEILTFPLIFNRIANLKADMEELVAKSKLDLDIFEAQLQEEHRKKLLAASEKVTESAVANAVKMDSRYSIKKKAHFEVQKNYNYLDSLYWAAQSKDTKLNRLSEKMRPEDFEKELVEDTINGVMIKVSKKILQ